MSAHRATKWFGIGEDNRGTSGLKCSCGEWRTERGLLDRDQREAHRQHRREMGEEVPPRKDSHRCYHCGRMAGGDEGGYATIDKHLVCHPTVPGRPNCYQLVTDGDEVLGSRKLASLDEVLTEVAKIAEADGSGCGEVTWIIMGDRQSQHDHWYVNLECEHGTYQGRTMDPLNPREAMANALHTFVQGHGDDETEDAEND